MELKQAPSLLVCKIKTLGNFQIHTSGPRTRELLPRNFRINGEIQRNKTDLTELKSALDSDNPVAINIARQRII